MQNGGSSKPADDSTELEQIGKVLVGDGAKREALLIGLGLSRLNSRQKKSLNEAKQYALDQSVRHVAKQQQIALQEKQQRAHHLTQVLSIMARLYIGSVSYDLHEETIREMFSVFGPIKYLNMSYDNATGAHKGFAFLEFEVPEAALLAKNAMDGKRFGGRNLQIGRTSNAPAAQPVIEMITQEATRYHRIYIASIHPSFQKLMSILSSKRLATSKAFNWHDSNLEAVTGFCYIEFDSEKAVREAIDGMNNFNWGGHFPQVGRCITPPDALMHILSSLNQSVLPTSAKVQAQ